MLHLYIETVHTVNNYFFCLTPKGKTSEEKKVIAAVCMIKLKQCAQFNTSNSFCLKLDRTEHGFSVVLLLLCLPLMSQNYKKLLPRQ